MYEVTCPTTGRTEHLGHDHVISSHRVSTGHVVYLRCHCGEVTLWSTAGASVHPRPPAVEPVRAA